MASLVLPQHLSFADAIPYRDDDGVPLAFDLPSPDEGANSLPHIPRRGKTHVPPRPPARPSHIVFYLRNGRRIRFHHDRVLPHRLDTDRDSSWGPRYFNPHHAGLSRIVLPSLYRD